MNKQKREYPDRLKEQAVSLLRSSERSAADIEWELGITPRLLSRWNREKAKKAGEVLQWEPNGRERQNRWPNESSNRKEKMHACNKRKKS